MSDPPLPTRLTRVLEPTGVGFLVLTASGSRRRRRMTSSFRRLLADDPQTHLLETAVEELGSKLLGLAAAGGPEQRGNGRPEMLARQVRTGRGTYRFFGTFFRQKGNGSAALSAVVAVAPPSAHPLAESALRERFGLTPREAELTRLLARGLTNTRIADAMGISPHTAHHYTERVLLKMDVGNRAQVAARILL